MKGVGGREEERETEIPESREERVVELGDEQEGGAEVGADALMVLGRAAAARHRRRAERRRAASCQIKSSRRVEARPRDDLE